MCSLRHIALIAVLAHGSWSLGEGAALPVAALLSSTAAQQADTAGRESGGTDADHPNEQLARLEMWIGLWTVTERHFNSNGDVVATVKGSEEVSWLLDRHAIKRDYRSGTESSKFHALGIWTFNDVDDVYQGIWFDNTGTAGPTLVKGEWDPGTLTMVATMESPRKNGSPVGHRVVERFIDPDHREATTYRLDGTELTKRMQVEYVRAIPCPGRIRTIFDDALSKSRRGG